MTPFHDDDDLSFLLHQEQEMEPQRPTNGIGNGNGNGNPSFPESRADAVAWMLNVVHYYSFSAVTAVVAVNYLDRFADRFHSDLRKPWMTHLAAVASLSLSAKLHETRVPLLPDLQVNNSIYSFDSKTVQRMEILILSTLNWKMNAITPIPFLHCIAARLGFQNWEFLITRSESILLSLVSDSRFSYHLPSALATATMVYVLSSLGVEYKGELRSILGSEKEKVENCWRLIQEVVEKKMPGSPKGVLVMMDGHGCLSSDTSNDSWSSK